MRRPFRYHVLPCAGPRCGAEQAAAMKDRLKELLPDRKALGIRVSTSSCQGMCVHGPNVLVYPEGVAYHQVELGEIERIVQEHLREGRVVEEFERRQAREPAPRGEKSGELEPNSDTSG